MMGADSVEYHRSTVLERSDDHAGQAIAYYASRGETPLVWGGTGAGRLGLAGVVTDADYESMYGPGGAVRAGENWRLVSTMRPGVELVVAAHKSVAVLGVLGRAEDMHSILDAERDATLAWLDGWFQARGGRRGREQHRTRTHGLTWSVTRHATSRAGDPSPHDHVLVANVVAMADERGGWKALDTAALRDVLHAATAVGRHAAAHRAVELGYGIEPDNGPSGRLGHFRISGIPDAACDVLSKRSEEIAEYLEQLGLSSYRAAGIAARETRAAKTDDEPVNLVRRWRDELTAAGHKPRRLLRDVDDAGRRYQPPGGPLTAAQVEQLTAEVLGPESRLGARKVLTRADLLVAVAPHLHGRPAGELPAVVDRILRSRELVPLVAAAGARDRAWCPAWVLRNERAIAHSAARLVISDSVRHVPAPAVTAAIADTARRRRHQLADEQVAAVHAICQPRRLTVLVGVAGAGKTTALDAARAAHENAGWQVVGCATSGQAAKTLGTEANVTSRTVTSLLWQLDHDRIRLDTRSLVILDEAGMTCDPDLQRLLEAIDRAGAKVAVVGDPHQLDAVGPGGALAAVLERHPAAVVELRENRRQRDPGERAALAHLRDGDPNLSIAWYAEHGRIHTNPDHLANLVNAAIAADTDRAAGHDTLLLAWRRRDVDTLNRFARQRNRAMGRLGDTELTTPGGGRSYATGDLVVVLQPDHQRQLVTSQRGVITGIDIERRAITVDLGDRHITLDGDALGADRLDHAYATTIHRAQGATVDRAHVIAAGGSRQLAYVALSRARHHTTAYVTADHLDQAVKDLGRAWNADDRRRWVLDREEPPEVTAISRRLDALGRRHEPPGRGLAR